MERNSARVLPAAHTEIGELIDGELVLGGGLPPIASLAEATLREPSGPFLVGDDEATVTPGGPVPAWTPPAAEVEDDEQTVQARGGPRLLDDEELRTVCAYEELPLPEAISWMRAPALVARRAAPAVVEAPAAPAVVVDAYVPDTHVPHAHVPDTHVRAEAAPLPRRSAAYLDEDQARVLKRIEAAVTCAVLEPALEPLALPGLASAGPAWSAGDVTDELASDILGAYGASDAHVAPHSGGPSPRARSSGFHDVAPQRYIRTQITSTPKVEAHAGAAAPEAEVAAVAEPADTYLYTPTEEDRSRLFPVILTLFIGLAGAVICTAQLLQ